MDETL